MGNRLAAVARPAGDRLVDLGVALVLVGGLVLPVFTARAATGDPVLLNELLVSHTGNPDTTEFVELYGTPGHSLQGVSLVVVEGDNSTAGTIDLRVDFDADDRLGGNGFFLLGRAGGLNANYGVVPDVALSPTESNVELFENGSQTLALVVTATVGEVGTQVTGTETVLDSVGLWDGADGDTFPWSPVLGLDDGFLPPGARRVEDGDDTDDPSDWVFADDLLGRANTPTPGSPVDEAPTATCQPSVTTTFGTAASADVEATDPDGVVSGFTLSAEPDPGTLTVTDVAGASATGETATASVAVGAATPAGTYDVTVTALTDATPPQEATCMVSVTVDEAPPPPPPPPADDGTLDELLAAFDSLVADGSVDERKGAQLRRHLERASGLAERGMDAAVSAQLRAFANHVASMSPRWVTPTAADELGAAVDALLAG